MAGIGSNSLKDPGEKALVVTVKEMGPFPALEKNKPHVSIGWDDPAPVYGVSEVSVTDRTKPVDDTCSSGRGFCVGPGETISFVNELGLLTTFGKANFM